MRKRIFNFTLRLLISGFSISSAALTVSYNDVLVVINDASGISDSVGEYFANARNISEQNIVRVIAPTTEEIDSVQFENLRQQIESALVSRNLQDSINYIVTTKGLPHKVKRIASYASSSVENELTLILGRYSSYIGKTGKIISPYYKKRDDFSRSKYGIYLVTRLDGYTYNDVKGLIDRASVMPDSIPSTAQFVFDTDPLWTSAPALNGNMVFAADSLLARGIASYLDETLTFVTDKTNVLGYTSFGSNDHSWSLYATHAIPRNTYLPGAIAETYVSTSARSFAMPPIYGQSLIADLIAEGITAVKGYVYEPYANAMADVSVLFTMYVDGYTIAESYFSASPFLSWMDLVIGDPKFRLVSTRVQTDTMISYLAEATVLPVELASFTATCKQNNVVLSWKTATETNCYGFDIERRLIGESLHTSENSGIQSPVNHLTNSQWSKIGFVRGSGTNNTSREYSYIDQNPTPGRYAYRLRQIDNDGSYRYYGNSEIDIIRINNKLVLQDNYPNPFNPSTHINFTAAYDEPATLCIYNILGQKVATLFHQTTLAGQSYQVIFDASAFPSGTYFARLESHQQSVVKRMVLAK
jgi:uncharacterized protein (TIGR03790 family)